jgi:hypothetical protein
MLTHWGRLDLNHTSNTAYLPDDYSNGIKWPGVLDGEDVKTLYEGHACYDPVKVRDGALRVVSHVASCSRDHGRGVYRPK